MTKRYRRVLAVAILGIYSFEAAPVRPIGNGAKPICGSPQLGWTVIAPLPPQAEHRAHRRSLSLDASGPHRMMIGASAAGAACGQARQ
jgi:hypothetical protein